MENQQQVAPQMPNNKQNDTQESTYPPKNNLILSVIAILVIASGVYFYSINREKNITPSLGTDTIKTYSNDQYGFEIKYPATLIMVSDTSGVISFTNTSECELEYKKPHVGDNYVPAGCFGLSIMVQNNKITHEGIYTIQSPVIVDQIQAERIVTDDGSYFELDVQFNKNGQWYIISGSSNISEKKMLEDTINQILSSFRFTSESTNDFSFNSKVIASTNQGIRVEYTAIVSGVFARSSSGLLFTMFCPKEVKASYSGVDVCKNGVRIEGNTAEVFFLNDTGESQQVTTIAKIISGKDNKSVIAQSKTITLVGPTCSTGATNYPHCNADLPITY